MKKQFALKSGLFFSLVLLICLPGCNVVDWFKGKTTSPSPVSQGSDVVDSSDSSQVIVTIGSKPLITKNRLEKEKENLLASNPQLRAMLAFMPTQELDRNLVEGLTNQAVVDRYIQENKINDTPEYKAEYDRMLASVGHMLNTKYFSQKFPATVTDEQAKEFYEKNKNSMPQLLLSSGGVECIAIMFDTQAAAKGFLAKVEAHKGDLEKAAKEMGLSKKVQDFKVVNNQSVNIDPLLRDKIMQINVCPAVKIFEVNNKSHWVVSARKKEAAQYRPFEQVKDDLKAYLEKEKVAEVFNKEIDRLKKEYNVEINKEFFAKEAGQEGMMLPEGEQMELPDGKEVDEIPAGAQAA